MVEKSSAASQICKSQALRIVFEYFDQAEKIKTVGEAIEYIEREQTKK